MKNKIVLELEQELQIEITGPAALEGFEEICRPGSSDSHTSIALALGAMGKSAVLALVGALGHDDPFVREKVALALGAAGPGAEDAVDALVEALSDCSAPVREAAATAIPGLEPELEDALPPLIGLLWDASLDARYAAYESLALLLDRPPL